MRKNLCVLLFMNNLSVNAKLFIGKVVLIKLIKRNYFVQNVQNMKTERTKKYIKLLLFPQQNL